jgi:hypothetical protein
MRFPPGEGAALLQLALNCCTPQFARDQTLYGTLDTVLRRVPTTEAAAARTMPELLQPAAAHKLLLTAALRNYKAVNFLLGLSYMQRHLDAETLEAMLLQLMKQFSGSEGVAMMETWELLCNLPAAQQLSSQAAQRVILALTSASVDPDYEQLPSEFYSLPGVQQLSNDQVMQLLAADPEHTSCYCIEELCQLPAAQQLSGEQVAQLLVPAAQQGCSLCSNLLCQLPAAQQLSSEMLMKCLLAAVQQGYWESTHELCQLSTAQQLSTEQVVLLLEAAVQQDGSSCISELCELPAAQQLSSEMLMQCLPAAVQQGDWESTQQLCQLPAAQQLSSEQVLQCLSTAAQQACSSCTRDLCRLPAAQQFSTEQVVQLLATMCRCMTCTTYKSALVHG